MTHETSYRPGWSYQRIQGSQRNSYHLRHQATSKEVKKYFFLLKIRDQMKAAEHFYSIHKNEDYAFLC